MKCRYPYYIQSWFISQCTIWRFLLVYNQHQLNQPITAHETRSMYKKLTGGFFCIQPKLGNQTTIITSSCYICSKFFLPFLLHPLLHFLLHPLSCLLLHPLLCQVICFILYYPFCYILCYTFWYILCYLLLHPLSHCVWLQTAMV